MEVESTTIAPKDEPESPPLKFHEAMEETPDHHEVKTETPEDIDITIDKKEEEPFVPVKDQPMEITTPQFIEGSALRNPEPVSPLKIVDVLIKQEDTPEP